MGQNSTQDKEIDLDDHVALAAEGDILFSQGKTQLAVGHYMMAMAAAPNEMMYKGKFLASGGRLGFSQYNEVVLEKLQDCLDTPNLDCAHAWIMWFSLLTHRPPFSDFMKLDGQMYRCDVSRLEKAGSAPYVDPYFLGGLRKLLVLNEAFEQLAVQARKTALFSLFDERPLLNKDEVTNLAQALCVYCFETEYIFPTADLEKDRIKQLQDRAESGQVLNEAEAAVLCCYIPLYDLKDASSVTPSLPADIVETHLHMMERLQERAKNVQAITAIDPGVSSAVRAQYESFPYPRWKTPPPVSLSEDVRQRLPEDGKFNLLNAGCGTGQEAAQFAALFPNADITAVDLSTMSIAYAQERFERLGIKNVHFHQADILNLGSLNQKFDVITSGGVLHHLEDPMRGWRVLVDILKPGGVMSIGLYSKIARKAIYPVRDVIAEKGYAGTKEGMYQFRHDAKDILPADVYESILAFGDYYIMSTCRDLLFHVQETCYTWPDIEKMLADLGLKFLIMGSVPQDKYKLYQKTFPQDPKALSLKNWNTFEQAHPKLFRGMYQFWCVKE